jgi:HK97 family phage prohead protease
MDNVTNKAERATFPTRLCAALDLEERSYTALFPYNKPDVLRRIFVPGVFADFLAAPLWQVQHLWVHDDWALPLGPVLELTETEEGLLFKAQFSDTVLGRDAWQLVQDGALSAVSISWMPQVVERVERGGVVFMLQQKAQLFDVSPVNFGGMRGAKILRDRMASHFGEHDTLATVHPESPPNYADCCHDNDCFPVIPLPPVGDNLALIYDHLDQLAAQATGDGAPPQPLEGACNCSAAQRRARENLRLLGLRQREGE